MSEISDKINDIKEIFTGDIDGKKIIVHALIMSIAAVVMFISGITTVSGMIAVFIGSVLFYVLKNGMLTGTIQDETMTALGIFILYALTLIYGLLINPIMHHFAML